MRLTITASMGVLNKTTGILQLGDRQVVEHITRGELCEQSYLICAVQQASCHAHLARPGDRHQQLHCVALPTGQIRQPQRHLHSAQTI